LNTPSNRSLTLNLEKQFNPAFATTLALREKQIQQNYRPIIGVHKWFARRPGTVFRSLLLAEYNGTESLETSYWRAHTFRGVIADPFMGGGTPIYEANRLGFSVVGADVNPMAWWVVRQSLAPLDLQAFASAAEVVAADVDAELRGFYNTECTHCHATALVKYFIWVKTSECPHCESENDLFPGYLLAENERHPRNVVACQACGCLNEFDSIPRAAAPSSCIECGKNVAVEGSIRRGQCTCRKCGQLFAYPPAAPVEPPRHRMWAIEYHCQSCKPTFKGRFFKRPDAEDIGRYVSASKALAANPDLPIPTADILPGDESDRLHRWGYRRYREMFNDRQLLGLGMLLRRIRQVEHTQVRHALLTVFSDFLRYQNILCRYDTYALKCQDIFSVHGFPVGLVQCENNLLGIPRVGAGAYRHFVEKYIRAKEYCRTPFETRVKGSRKEKVPIPEETIGAEFSQSFPGSHQREAFLMAAPAATLDLPPDSLDGVFTDPPYFDNVQYAELIDFCYVWLRLGLVDEFPVFLSTTTRADAELTGNTTQGKGIEHFTAGLAEVFSRYASALKPGAPFVFTYHHNDPGAYVPLIIAILDAGLTCTATLPAAAEMNASLHILGTGSSVLDSVFVCRSQAGQGCQPMTSLFELPFVCCHALANDAAAMRTAGLKIREGDLRCLLAGHIARFATNLLGPTWEPASLEIRMRRAKEAIVDITRQIDVPALIAEILDSGANRQVEEKNAAAV